MCKTNIISIQTILLAFILTLRHANNDRGLVNINGLECPHESKFVKSNTSEDIDSVTLLPIVKMAFQFYSYIKKKKNNIVTNKICTVIVVPVSTRYC